MLEWICENGLVDMNEKDFKGKTVWDYINNSSLLQNLK